MKTNFEEMLPQLTEFLKSEARTDTIVGQSFDLGEFTCVPVIRLGLGFGSGMGEGNDPKQGHGEGGGVAGGMGIEPIGFLVSRGEQISFVSTRGHSGLTSVFEKVPGLIEKFMDQKKEKEAVAS